MPRPLACYLRHSLLILLFDSPSTRQIYRKWNERLYEELYNAYGEGRLDKDPTENWYAHWIHEGFKAAELIASEGPFVFGNEG